MSTNLFRVIRGRIYHRVIVWTSENQALNFGDMK